MERLRLNFSGLSIERLLAFQSVVEAGSMAIAAKRDPSKQGQLSRQIRELQGALGVELFRKEGRSLRLTESGVQLAALTNAYFASLADLSSENGDPRSLKLGAAESVIRWLLIPRLAEISNAAEGAIDFESARTDEVVAKLENGQLDIGIVRSDATRSSLRVLPFATMRYALVVPRSLLPGKSAAGIHDVQSLPFVFIAGDGQMVRRLGLVLEQNNLRAKSATRVQSISLAIEAAKVLHAAVIVPTAAAAGFPAEDFTQAELKGIELLDRSLSVATAKRSEQLSGRSKRFAQRLSRLFERENAVSPVAAGAAFPVPN